MSGEYPKVSVCLMTYNGAGMVERALRTLLNQTYRDYELIVSDDHSTDDTLAICQRLASGHDQVRFIRPERNLGAYRNMRFVLSNARGKYFVWASQDDYWEPEFLERLVAVLQQSPTAVCAQGRVRRVLADGSATHEFRLEGRNLPELQSRLRLAVSILARRTHRWGVFIHGVCDRVAYTAALDAHGEPPSDERQILCLLALAGEYRYVDQLLFHKVVANVPLHERRSATDATVVARRGTSRSHALRATLAAIVRSPTIAPSMKLIALPTLYGAYCWNSFKRKTEGRVLRLFKRILPAPQFGILRRMGRAVGFGESPNAGPLRKKR